MHRTLAAMGIAVLLLGTAVGAGAADNEVNIGYLRLVMSLPTFVAAEKGLFKGQGLEVALTPFQSGTAIVDALMAGRIDADCGSAISGHWLAEQNVPGRFKIFLVYGPDNKFDNTFVAVVRKDSPIRDLKGLKGAKVGHFPGATSRALARAVIATQVDPAEVTFIEIPPPNMVPALVAGQIDAFFSPEPMGMMAVSKGVGKYLGKHPVAVLNLERGYPGGAFTVSSNLLKNRPETAVKLMKAYDGAVDFICGNEKEARTYLQKYAGLPGPVAMAIPFDKWIKIKELDKKSGEDYFEVLFKEGAFKSRLDTTTLYYE
jgi:ABC-type nitrate/sulfonate/bicarbonate transport system substrate-binding protein